MRLVPRRWHNETWVCSIRGHAVPAAAAERLRPDDAALGVDLDDGTRVSRCLRCDLWMRTDPPTAADAAYEVVPPLAELDLPRRGKPLEDAILLRVIAIDRGIHGVLFGVLTVALLIVKLRLPRIQAWAQSLLDSLNGTIDNTSRAGHVRLSRELESLLHLSGSEITVLLITAAIYAVVESVEAVGLWRERRWAEYLTVLATAGFIPFEVRELMHGVSALKVIALTLNVAILVWLVVNKRLFGVGGGEQHPPAGDPLELFASPPKAVPALSLDPKSELEATPSA